MPTRRLGIVSLAATVALAATACGGHTSTPAPAVQAVGDTTAKQLLVTGFKAARELGRETTCAAAATRPRPTRSPRR